jgi:hypothetical protein
VSEAILSGRVPEAIREFTIDRFAARAEQDVARPAERRADQEVDRAAEGRVA